MIQGNVGIAERKERLFLAVLIAVALVIRLYRIGEQSLWVDELLTLASSSPKEGMNIWSYLKYDIHGPLHSFVVYIFQLVSLGDAWLRVPSALAGAGTVLYFYLWIRLWLGKKIAWIGAALLTVHPLHLYYSQELRNYSFLLFFAVMACYYFERLSRRECLRDGVVYVLAVACAALSNFSAAFLFGAHTILYFVRSGITRRTAVRWVCVAVVLLVLISPWVYRIYTFIDVSDLVTPVTPGQLTDVDRLRGETTVTWNALPYAIYTFCAGFSLGPSTRELHIQNTMSETLKHNAVVLGWVGVLFGGVLLCGVWSGIRKKLPVGSVLLYILLPLVCVFVLNWQNAKAFNVRYALPGYPAFLCLLAIGVGSIPRRAGAVVLAMILATLMVADGNYYFNGRYAREDVKGTVTYLEERIGPDECILAPTVLDVVNFYYKGLETVYSVYAPPGTDQEVVADRMEPVFAECNSLWYIRARPWASDAGDHVITLINRTFRQTDIIYFDGVELFRFDRKKQGD